LIEIEVRQQGLAPAMDCAHRQQAGKGAFADAALLADECGGGRTLHLCHPHAFSQSALGASPFKRGAAGVFALILAMLAA
jgi:hypothetical protein